MYNAYAYNSYAIPQRLLISRITAHEPGRLGNLHSQVVAMVGHSGVVTGTLSSPFQEADRPGTPLMETAFADSQSSLARKSFQIRKFPLPVAYGIRSERTKGNPVHG